MSKNKSKTNKQKKRGVHTPLSKHQRNGSTLLATLSKTNITLMDWSKDLLPEHLWIAALADVLPIESIHHQFHEFMDIIDSFIPEGSHALGLLSDFALIPQDKRDEFWSKHSEKIRQLFHIYVGRILAFYPENPASWLVSKELIEREGALDPEVELNRLRNLVVKLLPGKDQYVGHLRTLPFARAIKHRLPKIPDSDVLKLLSKYPVNCTDEEKYHVQQYARMFVNVMYINQEHYKSNLWSKYFWRHNFGLVICKPRTFYIMGDKPLTEKDLPSLIEVLESNSKVAREYMANLWKQVTCDLYDTERDEILFGLFSRLIRLYCLIVEEPSLWNRDTGGIMLRCITECAITFSYLVISGSSDDFRKFRQYGDGQEKLLMLHLQDSYEGDTTLEGRNIEAISEELGGFGVEATNIELGHWNKKDTRKLAKEAGMERFYRLVYSPTSSDVHGTWLSLKLSSLIRCAEPLHRFHRLPSYTEPPAYINTIHITQEICLYCIRLAIENLGYPELSTPFRDIPIAFETKKEDDNEKL